MGAVVFRHKAIEKSMLSPLGFCDPGAQTSRMLRLLRFDKLPTGIPAKVEPDLRSAIFSKLAKPIRLCDRQGYAAWFVETIGWDVSGIRSVQY